MKHCIITIGREFGSGGHKVGQILADKLNIAYYDNELITLAAKRGELDEQKLNKFDEKKHHPYFYEINYEGNQNVKKGESVSDTLYQLQKDVILDIAQKQDAVIIGRCADFILKSAGIKTLSVFIAAPLEQKIRRTMTIEGLDEKTVLSLTKKKEKTRKSYYEKYTGKKWGKPESYDLYFDVSCFEDLNRIAEKIIEAYEKLKEVSED